MAVGNTASGLVLFLAGGKAEAGTKKVPDGEHRWPAVIAVLVATALYATLPNLVWPVCSLHRRDLRRLVVPLIAINPVRLTRETALGRGLSITQALLLFVANQVAVVLLVIKLTQPDPANGPQLLLSAAQVWVTNVIVVALVLWEMDRGGPFKRWSNPRSGVPAADLRFSQDEDDDVIDEVTKSFRVQHRGLAAAVLRLLLLVAVERDGLLRLGLDAAVAPGQGSIWARGVLGFVILALVIARAVSLLGERACRARSTRSRAARPSARARVGWTAAACAAPCPRASPRS